MSDTPFFGKAWDSKVPLMGGAVKFIGEVTTGFWINVGQINRIPPSPCQACKTLGKHTYWQYVKDGNKVRIIKTERILP